jgi:hypothetical protein
MSRSTLSCLALVLGVLLVSAAAQAYTLGNPMGSTGKGKLSVSAEYEFQDRELTGAFSTESARYLLKASYGLSQWLDVFAKGGVAGLDVPYGDAKFVGEERLAWGAGARAALLRLPVLRAEVFTCAQIFGYRTRGSVDQQMSDASETWTRRLSSEYIWWEYGGALGIGIQRGAIWPYVGVDLSYVEGEKITSQYDIYTDQTVYGGESSGNFSSDEVIFSGLAGIDFKLPHRYKLSFEVSGSNPEDLSIAIGISQRSP